MVKQPAQVRGREPTGASCPSYNLAREAAALALATAWHARHALIPLGKVRTTQSLLVPRRPFAHPSHEVPTMSRPKRAAAQARPSATQAPSKPAPQPPRVPPAPLPVLHPNAAGIDVHSDMHVVCV